MPESNTVDQVEQTPKAVNITFQGKQERAEEVAFQASENWSEYRLGDGSSIKMKNVVSRILRLLDRKRDDGSPFYVVEGSAVLTTVLPTGENRSTENPSKTTCYGCRYLCQGGSGVDACLQFDYDGPLQGTVLNENPPRPLYDDCYTPIELKS